MKDKEDKSKRGVKEDKEGGQKVNFIRVVVAMVEFLLRLIGLLLQMVK